MKHLGKSEPGVNPNRDKCRIFDPAIYSEPDLVLQPPKLKILDSHQCFEGTDKMVKNWLLAGVLVGGLAACAQDEPASESAEDAAAATTSDAPSSDVSSAAHYGESVTDEVAKTVDCTKHPIEIDGAWVRMNPAPNRPAAGYMSLIATEGCTDTLTAASSPDAGRIELHDHQMTDGIMRMVKVPGIDIPDGQTVQLAPGGLHLMLFDMTVTPEETDTIPLVLTFENAGDINATAVLETFSTVPVPEKDGDHSHHH